jgi:hypothetical protein
MVSTVADAVIEGKAMRKEEIVEEEEAIRTAMRAAPEERELSDEELLGEATLAKLSTRLGAPVEEDVDDIYAADIEAEVASQARSEVGTEPQENELSEEDWQAITGSDEEEAKEATEEVKEEGTNEG